LRRRDLSLFQWVPVDPVIDFGIKPGLVECDARAAVTAFGNCRAEALDDVGASRSIRVFERHEEAVRRNTVIVVIDAAPRIHVDGAVFRHDKLAGVTEFVGED
jgi:hypothetical protein